MNGLKVKLSGSFYLASCKHTRYLHELSVHWQLILYWTCLFVNIRLYESNAVKKCEISEHIYCEVSDKTLKDNFHTYVRMWGTRRQNLPHISYTPDGHVWTQTHRESNSAPLSPGENLTKWRVVQCCRSVWNSCWVLSWFSVPFWQELKLMEPPEPCLISRPVSPELLHQSSCRTLNVTLLQAAKQKRL